MRARRHLAETTRQPAGEVVGSHKFIEGSMKMKRMFFSTSSYGDKKVIAEIMGDLKKAPVGSTCEVEGRYPTGPEMPEKHTFVKTSEEGPGANHAGTWRTAGGLRSGNFIATKLIRGIMRGGKVGTVLIDTNEEDDGKIPE